ncbi:MAG: binding site:FAD dependent oxidoreductase [Gammaproteobacteria bacterium]|jgi:L-2-hydroxyglutarate oxidase LhgO|nr:binding site:FAD dependent oxidoreductase [Gammaproteobacteria bacterium]
MVDTVDCVVIGAGVVGLAVARRLAQRGVETVVLEAEAETGTVTSSRNSEVIHAGIYYPAGSLKARLCLSGRKLLYQFCRDRGVEYRQCGKLIVAGSERERSALENIANMARANGVTDIVWLTRAEARAREPELECRFALHSPSTGIVDSHGFMQALLGDLEGAGGVVAFRSPASGGYCDRTGIRLQIAGDTEVQARTVINCAGLQAQAVARALGGLPASCIPPLYLAKGNYFVLRGKCPFSHLIYPAPVAAGLGTHLTLDLGGQGRFGPDVEWVDHIDYTVDPRRADHFYAAIRAYWPGLPDGALAAGYAGIRPKLQAPGGPPADFLIQGPLTHGIPGLVNLFGIESPGLTAALAIAEHVSELI